MPLPSQSDPKLWLVVLFEIEAAGGQVKPSAIYSKVSRHFPEITEADLRMTIPSGANRWMNRVQWVRQDLVEAGCIDRGTAGVWKITPRGRAWLTQHWRGANANYAGVPKPPKIYPSVRTAKPLSGSASKLAPSAGTAVTSNSSASAIFQVVDPVEALCKRLTETQRLSDHHAAFEIALRDAFAFLGFDATHIGGPSETDVLLVTHLNADSYRAIVDAKSTRTGKVADAQINWPVLDQHRKQSKADYAAVVGEDFSGGNLKKFAEEYKVTLLRTETVCEAVRLHARTPFSLLDLRELFAEVGLNTHGLESLRRRHAESVRHWRLLLEIVEQVEAYNRHVPAGLLPKAETLYHILLGRYINGALPVTEAPSLQNIQEALAFLASAAAAVLRRAPGSEDAYQLVMTSEVAKRRLSALAGTVAGYKPAAAAMSAIPPHVTQANTP